MHKVLHILFEIGMGIAALGLLAFGLLMNSHFESDTTTPKSNSSVSNYVNNEFSVKQAEDALNQYRQESNLPLLSDNNTLDVLAQEHATDMNTNNYYDHTTPQGVTAYQRITNALGTVYSGENEDNLCYNVSIGDEIKRFEDSPPHKVNMLDPKYNSVGVGIVFSDQNVCNGYLVYDFAQI